MNDTLAETDEKIPWWDSWANICYLADHLVLCGEQPRAIYEAFTEPWEFSHVWVELTNEIISEL